MLGCNRCGHIWDNCECSDKEVIGADRDMFEDVLCKKDEVCEHDLSEQPHSFSHSGSLHLCKKCGGEFDKEFLEELKKIKDLGSHYRHSFMGYKIDVYRVIQIFGVTDPVAQHIVKKLLRGTKKGHTEEFVWQEVTQAVERKNEMIKEDEDNG